MMIKEKKNRCFLTIVSAVIKGRGLLLYFLMLPLLFTANSVYAQVISSDFESGDLSGWTVTAGGGSFPTVQSSTVYGGTYALHMGDGGAGLIAAGGTATIERTYTIPASATSAELSLQYNVVGNDGESFDWMRVYVNGVQISSWFADSAGWQTFNYDLSSYAGTTITLTISSWTSDSVASVNYYLDDVNVSYQSGSSENNNGDFEAGDLTNWMVMAGGTSFPTVQSSTVYGGTYALHMGDGGAGLLADGGIATIERTYAIPASATTAELSLQYNVVGNDGESFDWMRVYVNGVQISSWFADTAGWQTFSHNLSSYAGTTITLTISSWTGDSAVAVNYYLDDVNVSYQSGGGSTINEAVDNTSLIWTSGGNANWFYETSTTYFGGDAAQSGVITHNGSSWIETTITGSGDLSFYWKVSSEACCDYLRFYINGVLQASINGEIDWQQRSYYISGTSTLRWEYSKDGSIDAGLDAGWLDFVTFAPSGANHILSISKSGSGNGTVTSSPAGINCGLNCTATFTTGSTVMLTASSDDASSFTGWSGGGCSGTGTCLVTLTADTTVTATFITNTPASPDYLYYGTLTYGGPFSTHPDNVVAVKTDKSGSIFRAGTFGEPLDFNPGPDVDLHSPSGGEDIYLTKINADGSYLWTKTMGGKSPDNFRDLAIDDAGNIYLTGFFTQKADFDPGPGVDEHLSYGHFDIFLTKINADGSYGWTKTMGGPNLDVGNAVSVDKSGNIYLAGSFFYEADVDPGPAFDIRQSMGGADIFLTKINVNGTYGWTKTFGGIWSDESNSLSVDATGNIYMTGYFSNTVDFNPGPEIDEHLSRGREDVFITKINVDGSYGWTKAMGGNDRDIATSVAVDSINNVYITGTFEGLADFNPGTEFDDHMSHGLADVFITKINGDGTYGWTGTIGEGWGDYTHYIAVDNSNNVYLTGYYGGIVDFDPFDGIDVHVHNGNIDMFLTKINADSTYGWTKTVGGTGTDVGYSFSIDDGGYLYTAGSFQGTVDFDPSPGTDERTAVSPVDLFISRFRLDIPEAPTSSAAPSGDIYNSPQMITLTCNDGIGSICNNIYFTTDGTVPTTLSTVYTGPINIDVNTTLKFFADDIDGNQEPVNTESYIIDMIAPYVMASIPGSVYESPQIVSLNCDDLDGSGCATIYYTTDGSVPTIDFTVYTGSIDVLTDMTLRFFAVDNAGNTGPELSENYIIDTMHPYTFLFPNGGIYENAQTVTLTCDDGIGLGCAGTHYTTDGTMPTIDSTLYTGPIELTTDTILSFFSVDNKGNMEPIQVHEYIIDPTPPLTHVVPAGGIYENAQTVVFHCFDGNGLGCAATHYTTDGSVPTLSSPLFVGPIELTTDTILSVFSVDNKGNMEPVQVHDYVIDPTPPNTLLSIPGGIYNTTQTLSISCEDIGLGCAATHYTTDGSIPTLSSPVYSGPIQIAADMTLSFFSVDNKGNQEPVRVENYIIDFIPPAVDAGLDQVVDEGTFVTQTGSATDGQGTVTAYAWAQVAGPAVVINGADTATMNFSAPMVNTSTVLTFELTATDNDGATASDSFNVIVHNVIIPPTVDAGLDQVVDEGMPVSQTGTASDSNGTVDAYVWTQVAGPAVTLTGADTPTMSFTVPFVNTSTVLTFDLTVTDNDGATASDQFNVTVYNVIIPPTVDAGLDQAVDEGIPVSQTGTASDSNGTVDSYAWTQVAGPAVTMNGADTPTMSFTAPFVNTSTVLTFDLTVTDNDGATATDQFNVTVYNVIIPPTVDAGLDQALDEGMPVSQTGTASDSNGTVDSYAWTQVAGPAVTMNGADTPTMSFTA
ncbi:MAG: chitobiase/beta-hexosaminidase C-terminal domain-containing protein, partial [Deltaproteobacteria bacterium]|nr:chitobiase/beta-hexosaminidase C-terminal domain-containing protein [Deltaproteobacteria bacterium]